MRTLYPISIMLSGLGLLLLFSYSKPNKVRDYNDEFELYYENTPPTEHLNNYILDASKHSFINDVHYKSSGSKVVLDSIGTRRDVFYLGKLRFQTTNSNELHCIGYLLDLYIESCERYANKHFKSDLYKIKGMRGADFNQFQQDFFGASGNRKTFVNALTPFAGDEIDLQNALPGDFVQYWRNEDSGHAGVYLSHSHTRHGIELTHFSLTGQGVGIFTETITESIKGGFEIYVCRAKVPDSI